MSDSCAAGAPAAVGRVAEARPWLETTHEYLETDVVIAATAHLELARIHGEGATTKSVTDGWRHASG